MNDIFQKFCYYLITKGTKEEYNEIKNIAKENKLNFKELQDKTINYVKELTKTAKKLGFQTDFESYSNMLEEYINKKEKLTDKKKSEYLKVLAGLSEIYEINLRSELSTYIKDTKDTEIINDNTIFNKFCLYNIKEDSSPQQFNELKEIALLNSINFNELNQKSIEYIENIKVKAEELNSGVDIDSFYKLLNKYLIKKKELKDKTKTEYLKVLVPLATIYNIDLKEELTKKVISQTIITNPLDNDIFLKTLIYQRYNNGSFNVNEITTPNTKCPADDEIYNSYDNKKKLIKSIKDIYKEKNINDINPSYQIVDQSLLNNLSNQDIIDILNSREENDLTKFINLLFEITDYTKEHIGNKHNNLFNIEEEKNTFAIYITTPNNENTYLFLNNYILKCIENNVSYDMYGFKFDGISRDRTILYANDNDIKTKIKILNEIENAYPKLIKKFGTPLESTSTINNSYYGIAVIKDHDSYQDYFNSISEISYYRVLAKLIINKVAKEEDKILINDFILLKKLTINNYNPLECQFNNNEFGNIKDLINKYIPDIINSLNIYMEQEDKIVDLISEFKKSLSYISNLVLGRNKKEIINIALLDKKEIFL